MDVFEFRDYRAFLRAWIKTLPRKGRGEINRLAEHLRVNATLISQTLSGTRNFTEEQAFSLSRYIGLSGVEAEYFELLVRIERSGTAEYRNHLLEKLESLRVEAKKLSKRVRNASELPETVKATFYSSYLYSAVRLFCSIGIGKSTAEVAERFSISRQKAAEILRFLVDHKLCIEEKNKFKIGPLITHLEASSPLVGRHHTNWRVKAIQKSENVSADELMFSGPLSVSKEDFVKIRETLLSAVADISTRVQASESEEIACLNVDLFWIET